jgi:hypothetical protein
MYAEGDSFLPRILSVFYAVFDIHQGPKIVHQVPEGLIAGGSSTSSAPPLLQSTTSSESTVGQQESSTEAVEQNESLISPVHKRHGSRPLPSPNKRSVSSQRILFHFDDVSKYVIPHKALCGRLVRCTTARHRVIGFPTRIAGNYARNSFQYNLGMVFERTADLSSYEPVVRKVSRVLTACEVRYLGICAKTEGELIISRRNPLS